jgi:hypothetical protein
MLNHKRRSLAVTGITVMSAALLTALVTTGASAATAAAASPNHAAVAAATVARATQAAPNTSAVPDTSPILCNTEPPVWSCIQVFGTGPSITSIHYWAHSKTGSITPPEGLHLELYLTETDSIKPPVPESSIDFLANSPEFSLNSNANSAAYSFNEFTEVIGNQYACVEVWWKFSDGSEHDGGYACAAVYA